MGELKFKGFIEQINFLKGDEEIKQFALSRFNELEQASTVQDISIDDNGIGNNFHGYINSDSPITSSFMVDPFYMNDLTLYIEFIKAMKDKNFANPLQLFHEVQSFIYAVFGFKGNQKIRESIYLQKRSQKISIADFYKNDSALCSERSAAVQNILSFCGIDSYLIFGKLSIDKKDSQHAYNILNMGEGTLILYDVTNPVYLYLKDDELRGAPAYSIIGKENIEALSEIQFDFDNIAKTYNARIHPNEAPRKYKTFVAELNKKNSDAKTL